MFNKRKKRKEAEQEKERLRLLAERREAFNKVVNYDWSGRNYPR
jgi:hypothetical protein